MKTILKGIISIVFISFFTFFASGQENDCIVKNEQFRNDKNKWIDQHENKPFSQADIDTFAGLFYYDIDCNWVLKGTLKTNPALKIVKVGTSKGGTVQVYDYGTLSINIDGKDYHLQVYKNIDLPEFIHNPETIFVPIKDATTDAGNQTTFGNGRYLIIQPPAQGNHLGVDFNMTINPFENYNNTFPSLNVPDGNVILAPVPTGERKYEDR